MPAFCSLLLPPIFLKIMLARIGTPLGLSGCFLYKQLTLVSSSINNGNLCYVSMLIGIVTVQYKPTTSLILRAYNMHVTCTELYIHGRSVYAWTCM